MPCCPFCTCVKDIAGLTDYQPWRLPEWLREELLSSSGSDLSNISGDEELVENEIASFGIGPWLIGWGLATIRGQEVFAFSSDTLTEPIALADELTCGLVFVERIKGADGEHVLYFTKDNARPSRRDVSLSSEPVLQGVV